MMGRYPLTWRQRHDRLPVVAAMLLSVACFAMKADPQLQKMLLARYRAYRASGLDGIAPYDRGGETRNAGEDLRKASDGATVVQKRFPAFFDMMQGYPKVTLPGMREDFFWIQYGKGDKANYVVQQLVTAADGDVHAVMQRQCYVSQGYNVGQAVAGLFPVEEGTLVVYVNRTSTDQVGGFGGSAKRSIGRKMMASQLERMVKRARLTQTIATRLAGGGHEPGERDGATLMTKHLGGVC